MKNIILFSYLIASTMIFAQEYKYWDTIYSDSDVLEGYTRSEISYANQDLPALYLAQANINGFTIKKNGTYLTNIDEIQNTLPKIAQFIRTKYHQNFISQGWINDTDIIDYQDYYIPSGTFNNEPPDPDFINYMVSHAIEGFTTPGLDDYGNRIDVYKKLIFTTLIPEENDIFLTEERFMKDFGAIYTDAINSLDLSQRELIDDPIKLLGHAIDIFQAHLDHISYVPLPILKLHQSMNISAHRMSNALNLINIGQVLVDDFLSMTKVIFLKLYCMSEARLRIDMWGRFVNENVGSIDTAIHAAYYEAKNDFEQWDSESLLTVVLDDFLYNPANWVLTIELILPIVKEAIKLKLIASGATALATIVGAAFIVAPIAYASWVFLNEGDQLLEAVVGACTLERTLVQGLPTIPNNQLEEIQYISVLTNVRQMLAFLYYGNFYDRMENHMPVFSQWLNQIWGGNIYELYKTHLQNQYTLAKQFFMVYRPDNFPVEDNWIQFLRDRAESPFGPQLYDGVVSPVAGYTNESFEFQIMYQGSSPANSNSMKVVIDGQEFNMERIDGIYTTGVKYSFASIENQFEDGTHEFYFEVYTGDTYLRFPESGTSSFEVMDINYPQIYNGTISPLVGYKNESFTFNVVYKGSNPPNTNSVKAIIDGQPYNMNLVGGNYTTGATYEYISSPNQFSVGEHELYFEAYEGENYLVYPENNTLDFDVLEPVGESISINLVPNPCNTNQFVDVSATLLPAIEGIRINFAQEPQKGHFVGPAYAVTNQAGVAQVTYKPDETGNVKIIASEDGNATNWNEELLVINTPPPQQYTIHMTHQRLEEIPGGYVEYEIYLRIYENGNPSYNHNIKLETNFGVWSQTNTQTITYYSSHYTSGQNLKANTDGTATIIVAIDDDFVRDPYIFQFQFSIPQMEPSIIIPESGVVNVTFKSNDDKFAYSTSDDKIKIFDLSENQVVDEIQFIAPSNSYSEEAGMLKYSPDGSKLLACSGEEGIRIYETTNYNSLISGRTDFRFYKYSELEYDVCWVDNSRILISDKDEKHEVINASNLSTYTSILTEDHYVIDVDAAAGYTLVSEETDFMETYLYNSSFSQIHTYDPSGFGEHLACSISPDGSKVLIFENYDQQIMYLYDNQNYSLLNSFGDNSVIKCIDWNPQMPEYVVTTDGNSKIKIWNVNSGLKQSEGVCCSIGEAEWSSDGNFVAVGGCGEIRIFAPFDLQVPTINISSPVANFETTLETIQLKGAVSDDNEVSYAEYSLNNVSWIDLPLNQFDQFDIVVNLNEGPNIIKIRAFDNYNKMGQNSVSGIRLTDQENPVIVDLAVIPYHPKIGENIKISAKVIDGWSGVDTASVNCFLEIEQTENIHFLHLNDQGASGDSVAGDGIYTGIMNSSALSEEKYSVFYYGSDLAGNSDTVNFAHFMRPFDLPLITDVLVNPDTIISGESFTVSAQVTDQSGIISCSANLISEQDTLVYQMANIDSSLFSAIIPPQVEGDLYFFIHAIDGNNNVQFSVLDTITFMTTSITKIIEVGEGWNIVSAPLILENMSAHEVFPTATSNIFGFENNYFIADLLENGKGYWAKFLQPQQIEFSGFPVTNNLIVESGWNLIGPFNETVSVEGIVSTPPNIISSAFYGFSEGYFIEDELEPGKGYWVKVTESGELILNNNLAKSSGKNISEILKDLNYLEIVDAGGNRQRLYSSSMNSLFSELPPLPPEGIFDARFSDNNFVNDLESSQSIMKISSAIYPVTIFAKGIEVHIQDQFGGKIINTIIRDGESIKITDKEISVFSVKSVDIPLEYSLSNNYPNPFNPSTTIRFGLPEKSNVKLTIYNSLGEEVSRLLDKELIEGYHEVEFNASDLASGVYFYSIQAGEFKSVKKMLLLK